MTKTIKEYANMVGQTVDSEGRKRRKVRRKGAVKRHLLSTGSTLLNLACTDSHRGGLLRGKYYLLVGDSTSGKTFLAMTCFAEATLNRAFRDYDLIYDNIEDGCLLDLRRLFNAEVARRVQPPAKAKDGSPIYSSTAEEFYYHLDDASKTGRPFVYILDSMDALTSDAEESKFNKQKTAHRKGKEEAGSYGDGKAKINSQNIRKCLKGLRESGSILIILSQTRDNLGFGFSTKTRSGGRSLRFYATVEVWTSVVQTIKRTIKGKRRQIGVRVKLAVKKNRITGKLAEVELDIYPSYGIDDTGSLVDYLVEEGWWRSSGKPKVIDADEFDTALTRDKLIVYIEEEGLRSQLRQIAGQCWNEIDKAKSLKRKPRYE